MSWPLIVVLLLVGGYVIEASRQKRCIVVQKQSGTHGDSAEGEDGSSESRKPIPDRRLVNRRTDFDVEEITPLPARYRSRRPLLPRLRHQVNPFINRLTH